MGGRVMTGGGADTLYLHISGYFWAELSGPSCDTGSSGGLLKRQRHVDVAAVMAALRVDHRDRAAMQLHHPAGDGQAQAGPAAARPLTAGEPLENPVALGRRDALALVGHREQQVIVAALGAHQDRAARRAVP